MSPLPLLLLAASWPIADTTPSAHPIAPFSREILPKFGSARWKAWSKSVNEEVRGSNEAASTHRWMVAHPSDSRMQAFIAQVEAGVLVRGVEAPRILRWISKRDGRSYTLVEYFRLVRHATQV